MGFLTRFIIGSPILGTVVVGFGVCGADLACRAWLRPPHEVMFMERMPARPGDRNANLRRALANARDRLAQERAYFADSRNRDAFYAGRKAHDADAKF
jgi:hypothetical protein